MAGLPESVVMAAEAELAASPAIEVKDEAADSADVATEAADEAAPEPVLGQMAEVTSSVSILL